MVLPGFKIESAQVCFVAAIVIGFVSSVLATSPIDCTPINPNDPTDYLRPDPWSCCHFYKCDNGNPVRFACPDGLYFSTTLKVCDWPRNVDCGKRPIPGQKTSGQTSHNEDQQYGGSSYNNDEQEWYDQNNGEPQTYNPNQGNPNSGQFYNNGQNNGQSADESYQPQDDSLYYPVQDYSAGPSIQEPISQGAENRPRPTVDDLYSGGGSSDYAISESDIRK